MKMKNVSEAELLGQVKEESSSSDEDSLQPLRCWDCNVNFTTKFYLNKHLFHHIKQPKVKLTRVVLPPLKITLKNTTGNGFEIVQSPGSGRGSDAEGDRLEEEERQGEQSEQVTKVAEEGGADFNTSEEDVGAQSPTTGSLLDGSTADLDEFDAATLEDINGIIESETGGSGAEQEAGRAGSSCGEEDNMVTGPIITEVMDEEIDKDSLNKNNYETIPGAEPTPPPDPSPDSYPKIRIKTTGLLKDPLESTCTITEITDDNPNGIPLQDSSNGGHLWSTPSLEDPLKLPESDDNILSLFNNNDRAKDFGFTTSDSEYISLDRLDNRNNSGALQLYNPPTSGSQNPLDSLTGLPMQALAQQVSRLQPSGNGMHQQNVLINIQQFPQAPPQAPYQPPPMYHHSGQPMYHPQPYQYQPPNPYYPPGPTYPPPQHQHMQQPPLPALTSIGQPMNQPHMNQPNQMGQPPMSQAQGMPPSSQGGPQNQNSMIQQQGQYRQTIPRAPGPRQPMPGQRMPMAPRQMNPRAPMATRQRAPMTRPRGAPMSGMRGARPRLPNGPANTQFRNNTPMKRSPDQIKQEQIVQAKKKRFDVLTPDKDDDDCQVICMQPKNTDGLPQIESVQGATSESAESSIMHLSDSITLSVRNPPPKPASPKKSDAKAVANILATRGITVTPTAKPKEKQDSPMKSPSPLNLNGAVSIIPSAKQQQQQQPKKPESPLPTVDLTDDAPSSGPKSPTSPQKNSFGLPYRCHLCPAQYPNALGLTKHKQNYHKTSAGNIDMGIPLINLKQPGILQKLGQLGIHNFIPLPTPQQDGTFAIPIINTRNPANVQAIGATNMLILGPVKAIPRPAAPNAASAQKPPAPQQK